MKVPKLLEHNFEPFFSVKHMMKHMKIANHLRLSNYLELVIAAAARDRLLEQMRWGHGDDDYSAVAREYLPDIRSTAQEETKTPAPDVQGEAGSPTPSSQLPTPLTGLEAPSPTPYTPHTPPRLYAAPPPS